MSLTLVEADRLVAGVSPTVSGWDEPGGGLRSTPHFVDSGEISPESDASSSKRLRTVFELRSINFIP